jgi:predicted lipoprotein with Yx(FWY)xxD motif
VPAAALAASLALAATAAAATVSVTLGTASSPALGVRVAANTHGRTLYALGGESAHHLLCRGECLGAWPPVTVTSAHEHVRLQGGLHGHLGLVRRSAHVFQVTLNGLPLYRYSEDHAKGEASGQGIESFGGTWHAVAASGHIVPSTSGTTAPPPMTTPNYGY